MNLNKSLVALAVMLSASVPAQSAVVFTLQEVGSDVVLSGSGTFNLAHLTIARGVHGWAAHIGPNPAVAGVGSNAPTQVERWEGIPGPLGITGPLDFGPGSGRYTLSTSASGDVFGFVNNPSRGLQALLVPLGYSSGILLSGTATFAGQTLASLGATLGTYTWTWGNGPSEDYITLKVGNVSAVPEPSAYALALAGLGVLGIWGRRQKAQKRPSEATAT
jgi:PEP-CTERM motif